MFAKWKSFWLATVGLMAIGIGSVLAYQQSSQSAEQVPSGKGWSEVKKAIENGLPKTAIDELSKIYDLALKEERFPEAIRAFATKSQLESQIAGDNPLTAIHRFADQLDSAPEGMRPVLHTLQAHTYWNYFQENRWRFAQRTTGASSDSLDVATWDLKRIFAEIDKHYSAALSAEDSLLKIPVESYNDLLNKGTLPDSYRPTLFDFLAFEALNFYSAGEQAGARPQDSFEFDANSPALGTPEEFLAWKPESSDELSVQRKAIALFQRLLTIHSDDENRSAYLDADLARLQFAYANSVGENRRDRYIGALKRFADTNALHELSSTAKYRWASLLVEEDERVEGRKIAAEGAAAHPESIGGNACKNLINDIESQALQVITERVWTNPASKFRVTYKNLTKLHARVYKVDWLDFVRTKRQVPHALQQEELQRIAQRKPEREWTINLPATEDFNLRTEDIDAPVDLPVGFYYLHVSANEIFTEQDNVVAATGVWVSKLAIALNQSWNSGRLEGFVLDSNSGQPIADAKITAITLGQRRNEDRQESILSTDRDGRFTIIGADQQLLLLASHGDDALAVRDGVYLGRAQPDPQFQIQCVLFTDRSIYRPGQQIQFKGICLRADTKANRYEVVSGHGVNVAFHDMNGNVVEMKNLRSNDFGSFSGTFNIPRERGTGSMSIQVAGMAGANIQVEEYKRPKFKVELKSPESSPKLMEEIAVLGNANSYTGVGIQNAKVTYRVQRVVRWPIWFATCYPWRIAPDAGAAQEIAHGTTTTDADGKFAVRFVALPDRSVDAETNPIFRYEVTADVTDSTGETRSESFTTSVGYVALEAGISAGDWQTTEKPVVFNLTTNSLDGNPIPAEGKVKVYRVVEPKQIIRGDILGQQHFPMPRRRGGFSGRIPSPPVGLDRSNFASWDQGELVGEQSFNFKDEQKRQVSLALSRGIFRAVVETKDRFGKPVQAIAHVVVIDPESNSLGMKIPNYFQAEKATYEPGDKFVGIWGTGYEKGQALVEVVCNGETLQKFWTNPQSTQTRIEQPINEAMRGGFTVRILFVRENRCYITNHIVSVPWTNKDLTLSWERLVSKLEPGKKEKFKLTVKGPKASDAVAELVAGMYDASLDAYYPHHWTQKISTFRMNTDWSNWVFQNFPEYLSSRGSFVHDYHPAVGTYRSFPSELLVQGFGRPMPRMMSRGGVGMAMPSPAMAPTAMAADSFEMDSVAGNAMMKSGSAAPQSEALSISTAAGEGASEGMPPQNGENNVNLENVSPRKNLQETAFFFPHVMKSKDGAYELEFVVPEALTSWKVMAFAHDKELRSGYLQSEVVTKKELMVEPTPPRFLREGDILEFSVKVSNTSDKPNNGKVALKLSSALTDKSVDQEFGNTNIEQTFALKPNESKSFQWKLTVPDGAYPVIYRAIGGTELQSDGEEGMLPVLSKRILVTESLPLPIRGQGSKDFEFKSLLDSANSDTLRNQSLTVQMVSQPAWYAVLSLPYLMEYPYECSEQTFNRLYANLLAQHIANSDPKIRRVLDVWKQLQPDALVSPLEKNQDIKSIMIEETPWLRDAQKETEARRNVGILFDDSRLAAETQRAMNQLAQMQLENGTWPWFAGGPENEYLSLYIVTGFGRLKNLGVPVDSSLALRAIGRIDTWMREQHERVIKESKDEKRNALNHAVCLYLYGRSFFLDELPVADENLASFKFWQEQAAQHWLTQPRQSQAQIALALHRLQDKETPKAILKSILEFSTTSEEMGMYWVSKAPTWWWYEAPIETQSIVIEAFDEVAQDSKTVEECKVWLLKQKQTQNWKTTKATADAIYALLLRGEKMLASDALVAVELGGETIKPENVEAGTGFYEKRFLRNEIKPEFGSIKVTKTDPGVSWGSVHWQYLEEVNKVKPYDGTPLKLEKKLYKKVNTKAGQELVEIATDSKGNGANSSSVEVGDELVTRIILRSDRDMEYIHLKDQRGSGTEPVNVLSGYRYQDGLGYFESTRDTASHFFIDYLRAGTYVFEYSVRVQHAGVYPSGMASIESMYAPEFNSHSASTTIEAKPQTGK